MTSRRTRFVRIAAALLTLTLSTQVAGAQVAGCAMMRDVGSGSHAAMTEHQHVASHAAPAAIPHDTQDQQTPGNTSCTQSVLCANAAAIPSGIMRIVAADHAAQPVLFSPSELAARALPPDSPPPRI